MQRGWKNVKKRNQTWYQKPWKTFQNGGQKNDAKNDLEKVTGANHTGWQSGVGGLARHWRGEPSWAPARRFLFAGWHSFFDTSTSTLPQPLPNADGKQSQSVCGGPLASPWPYFNDLGIDLAIILGTIFIKNRSKNKCLKNYRHARKNQGSLVAQNHVWRYTLRLFTHFAISRKGWKIVAGMCPKTSDVGSNSDNKSTWFFRFLPKDSFGAPKPPLGAKKWSYSFFCARFWNRRGKNGCNL